jgi:hypothetical protein
VISRCARFSNAGGTSTSLLSANGEKRCTDLFVPGHQNATDALVKQTGHFDSPLLGTISRKTSDSTDKFNGQNPLDIAIANALELLRG